MLRHTAKQPGSERLGDMTGLGHTERLKGQAPDLLQTKQTTGWKQRLLGSPLLEASPLERSLDWRPERSETDWPKNPPYSGTAGGKQPIWDNTKLDQRSPCRGLLTQGKACDSQFSQETMNYNVSDYLAI